VTAAALGEALTRARAHPRHVVLGAIVAGLLAGPWPGVVLALAVVAALLGGRRALALGALAGLLAGAWAGAARTAALDRTHLGSVLGRTGDLRITLLERPRPRRSGAQVALAAIVSGPGRGERVALRSGPHVSWPQAAVGAELVVRGRLVGLRAREGYLRRRNAHAVILASAITAPGARRGGLAGTLDRVRARAERGVSSGLDPPRAALARGMVLGQDEALSEGTRDEFRDSGLAHLLAASGQNVMLLAALALPALALLGCGLRARLGATLVLVAIYVPLAGAGPSIQRAGIMGAAGLIAGLAGRPTQRWYAVLLAAAVTLMINPRSAQDPGWQLSFAAIIGIGLLAPRLRGGLAARRVPPALAEAASITAAATLATAPLLALHFDRVSLASGPANLLAAPAVGPVMWLGMLAALAGIAGVLLPVAGALNAPAGLGLGFVGWVAHATAGLPGAALPTGPAGTAVIAALCALLAAAVLVRGARVPALLAALVAAAAGLHAARPPAPPDPRDLVVSFLDIGQGDATLLQRAGLTVLVDTGPPGSPLTGRLRAAGVRRLDVLVVTHGDADHSGGALDVLRSRPVGLLVMGADGIAGGPRAVIAAEAARRGVRRISVGAGESVRAGPLEVRILSPRRATGAAVPGAATNDLAIVAHVRDGPFDLLLPADAESNVQGALVLPEVEALKVAHHGSEDPGLPDLVARLRPRLAVIEVGRRNTFGHPRRQALAALAAVPALYRTDRDGTVRLTVRAGRMTVATGA